MGWILDCACFVLPLIVSYCGVEGVQTEPLCFDLLFIFNIAPCGTSLCLEMVIAAGVFVVYFGRKAPESFSKTCVYFIFHIIYFRLFSIRVDEMAVKIDL